MKKLFQFKALTLMFVALFVSAAAMAQPANSKGPIPSPRDSVSGDVAGSQIKIWYGSPSVKGRVIFGKLEAYGKVWRAGANEATQFTTSKDIMVEGKKLPAGKYAFFLVPAENGEWTAIFNKTAVQWGAFKYDEKQDELRVMVKAKKIANQERLVYTIDKKGFAMKWAETEIWVSVK